MTTIAAIFATKEKTNDSISTMTKDVNNMDCQPDFNGIVDLCGIFKRLSIQDICSYIRKFYGPDKFH